MSLSSTPVWRRLNPTLTTFIITIVCCVGVLAGLALQMDRGSVVLIGLRIDRGTHPTAFWAWAILVAVMVVSVAAGSAWWYVREAGP